MLDGQELWITLGLVALLGAVFLKGFREAIGVAVVLVILYLALNAIVIVVAAFQVAENGHLVTDWSSALTAEHGNIALMVAVALTLFPKLALGMSGFETGVAVMNHVEGDASDSEERPLGRIRNTKRLLTAAACVMSVYLIASSLVTTLLIPAHEFEDGGSANGRALAFLAHEYLGEQFGTLYDVSTIMILWFAGASAMAGMLNLIPRYLPRYGMAPEWAGAVRPLVVILTLTAFLITWIFDADVDAQGGAYATGVLVLMTSAAVAVTLAARRAGQRKLTFAFALICLVFAYTTADNVLERPDGVKIGAAFISAIMLLSLLSRLVRALELRTIEIEYDAKAESFIRDVAGGRTSDSSPTSRTSATSRSTGPRCARSSTTTTCPTPATSSSSRSPSRTTPTSRARSPFTARCCTASTACSPSRPRRSRTRSPRWCSISVTAPPSRPTSTSSGPRATRSSHVGRFLLFGVGDVAPITREVLRRAEPDRTRRPHVHVG